MASNTTFEEIVQNRGVKTPLVPFKAKNDTTSDPVLPVKGGRETLPEGYTSLSSFFAEMMLSSPDFNIELLKGLEKLSIFHADFSYAVENIVTLGNTPFTISFDDKVDEELESEMQDRITARADSWYAFSGGINSLVNDLLAQAAVNGAISAEIVPNLSLDGVDEIVKVTPKTIRFKMDDTTKKYKAVQLQAVPIVGGFNYIELNPATYHYIASRRVGDKPYAIPPFLASLDQISVERNIMNNFATVIKNVGALGFLEVLVNAPKALPNESDEAYFRRAQTYLDRAVPEIEKGMSRGFSIGFKDKHEFQMHNTTVNVQGAKDLIEINDVKKMAGFKQDPLMFGRNFSTTETLGRVILAKMTTQVSNYQKLVASLLAKAYLMDLQLAGYPVSRVFIEFEKPMVGDKNKDEEARGKQINNLKALYNQGIIDQKQFASEAGYEKPALDEPIPIVDMTAGVPEEGKKPKTDNKKTDPSNEKTTDTKSNSIDYEISEMEVSLGSMLPEFEYQLVPCCGDHDISSFAGAGNHPRYSIEWWAEQYAEPVQGVYKKAIKKITGKLAIKLEELGQGATQQQITDAFIHTILKEWGVSFSGPLKRIVTSFVGRAYKYFRGDKSIFDGAPEETRGKIPNGAFNTIDLRALEYYKNSDSFYLGKFITDEDTKRRITEFIKENYLTRELWIRDQDGIEAFKAQFGNVLLGMDWKINQIIATTVNRMRNTASLNYIDSAEIEEFEIRGINDRLQCKHCSNMQGKTFSVKKGMELVRDVIDVDPENVGTITPFLSSRFKNPDDIKELTGEQLQASGINTPPFHPFCRDRIIAKFE